MTSFIITLTLFASMCGAATTNYVLQISVDGTQTIPPNTVATKSQVAEAEQDAQDAHAVSTNIETRAVACADKVRLYGTNYVVTSTVYVQSVGGVPYDPSNQTVRVYSIAADAETVTIIATVRQTPLVTPTLDWRAALNTGAFSNLTATVTEVPVPDGATNAVKAYQYTLPRPAGGSAYFRIVDNSTGASGSGLWWVVFGGITVDGKRGYTGNIIVTVNGVEYILPYHGGILTEPVPLGGL